jgi:hypothetical protein
MISFNTGKIPPMKPLTREEFQDAIQKGLGRVIMHLREYGSKGLKDDILNACVHNLVFDTQCEIERTDWLISIINLTGEEDFYREEILKALLTSDNSRDVIQLIDLAKVFAQRGCAEAKKTIYDKFDRREFSETSSFAETLLDIDGINGLIRFAEAIGNEPEDERDDWGNSWIYDTACERFGKEAVRAELSRQANVNENVRRFLDALDQIDQEKSEKRQRHVLIFEQTLNDIEAGKNCRGQYGYFGRRFASQNELEQLFARLLAETRREQLLSYLWVFRRKELPALDKKLFELAASEDKELQAAAINALSNSKEASIRDLAIRLIRENRDVICRSAIGLFEKNYQPGDYALIESALFTPEDRDVLHRIAHAILDLGEANPLSELANCLLWVYEQTPCTNCRENAVKCLIKLDCLPDSVREECRWDCSDDIRELVKTA